MLGVVEVDGAHHGQHLAGARPHGDDGGVGRVARSDVVDVVARGVLGGVLQVEVEAGRDLQAVAEQRLGAEAILDQLAHVGRRSAAPRASPNVVAGCELELRASGGVALRPAVMTPVRTICSSTYCWRSLTAAMLVYGS